MINVRPGQIVFLANACPDPDISRYRDGEYVVTQVTPNIVYGVSLKGGWSSYTPEAFVIERPGLYGEQYKIHNVYDDPERVWELIRDLEKMVDGPHDQWVERVYDDAAKTVARLREVMLRQHAKSFHGSTFEWPEEMSQTACEYEELTTKMVPIDECPACPELDAVISALMGEPGVFWDYIYINGGRQTIRTWIPVDYTPMCPPGGWRAGKMPRPYSSYVAAAWDLVERARKEDGTKAIHISECGTTKDGCWHVSVYSGDDHPRKWANANEFPLAVSRAYSKLHGVKYVEVRK